MSMLKTKRDHISELPHEQFSARRAMYTDEEWQSLWELNAYPFQLPPEGDWVSWTVLGGGGVGVTTAGRRWMVDKFLTAEPGTNLVSIHHHMRALDDQAHLMWDELKVDPDLQTQNDGRDFKFRNTSRGVRLVMLNNNPDSWRGLDATYLWADDITDATQVRASFIRTSQFCFTRPVKLDPETIVTRA